MPFWHKHYFELEAIENQWIQKNILPSLAYIS